MTRARVDSSAAASVGYDPLTRSLEVEFHGKNGDPGKVWRYTPVSEDAFAAMMAPEGSIGRALAGIKANPLIAQSDVTDEVLA